MQYRYSLRHAQRGAALIVGLVLMAVLTILAISTMRTATLELSMAGNTQYRATAQALAEAGLHVAIDQIDQDLYDPVALPGPDAGGWTNGIFAGSIGDDPGDTFSVDILYRYEGPPPPGTSLDQDVFYFELRSTGRTTARNARVVLRRGFWKLGG